MSTFDELQVGDSFETAARAVTAHDADTMVQVGGYTHPLFADPAFAAASSFGKRPLPGQALLLLMGGLIEQSGRFDDTVIALLGFDEVNFRAPAFEGSTIRVRVEVLAKELVGGGKRGILTMAWSAIDQGQTVLVDAIARMMFAIKA